jgi:hypothetical protein
MPVPAPPRAAKAATTPADDGTVALTLATSSDIVFLRARKHADSTYRANLYLGIGIGVVFIAGIGLLVGGFVIGTTSVIVGGSGTSVLSALGAWVFKPQQKISENLKFISRIEAAQAQCQDLRKECDRLTKDGARFKCFNRVWDTLKKDLQQL